MSNMKTPLKNVRGLGSARAGTEHFLHQRLTAIANIPLVLFLIWFIVSHQGASRADVIISLKNPLVAVALLAAVVNIFWHMRIGLQTVIEDYVHTESRKLALLALNLFYVTILTAVGAYSILKMGFGL